MRRTYEGGTVTVARQDGKPVGSKIETEIGTFLMPHWPSRIKDVRPQMENLIVVETRAGEKRFLGPEDAIQEGELRETSAGGSMGGHDPRAHGKIRYIVRAFGTWAKGKQHICVQRLLSEHPEVASTPERANALCAWLKDQWAGTTKWRGPGSSPKQKAEDAAISAKAKATAYARFTHAMPEISHAELDMLVEVFSSDGQTVEGMVEEFGLDPKADPFVALAEFDAARNDAAVETATGDLGDDPVAAMVGWLAAHGDLKPIREEEVAVAATRIAEPNGPLKVRNDLDRRVIEAQRIGQFNSDPWDDLDDRRMRSQGQLYEVDVHAEEEKPTGEVEFELPPTQAESGRRMLAEGDEEVPSGELPPPPQRLMQAGIDDLADRARELYEATASPTAEGRRYLGLAGREELARVVQQLESAFAEGGPDVLNLDTVTLEEPPDLRRGKGSWGRDVFACGGCVHFERAGRCALYGGYAVSAGELCNSFKPEAMLNEAGEPVEEAKLTAATRNALPSAVFVFPAERRYPIHDLAHAKNALARSSGKPEQAKVWEAVYSKFPALKARKRARAMTEAQIVDEAMKGLAPQKKNDEGVQERDVAVSSYTRKSGVRVSSYTRNIAQALARALVAQGRQLEPPPPEKKPTGPGEARRIAAEGRRRARPRATVPISGSSGRKAGRRQYEPGSARQGKVTVGKYEGDDEYSWAVFIDGKPWLTGLTKREVPYYRKQAQKKSRPQYSRAPEPDRRVGEPHSPSAGKGAYLGGDPSGGRKRTRSAAQYEPGSGSTNPYRGMSDDQLKKEVAQISQELRDIPREEKASPKYDPLHKKLRQASAEGYRREVGNVVAGDDALVKQDLGPDAVGRSERGRDAQRHRGAVAFSGGSTWTSKGRTRKHPLDLTKRQERIGALEAMHDGDVVMFSATPGYIKKKGGVYTAYTDMDNVIFADKNPDLVVVAHRNEFREARDRALVLTLLEDDKIAEDAGQLDDQLEEASISGSRPAPSFGHIVGEQLIRRVRQGDITWQQAMRTAKQRRVWRKQYGKNWRRRVFGKKWRPGAVRQARISGNKPLIRRFMKRRKRFLNPGGTGVGYAHSREADIERMVGQVVTEA